MLQGPSTIFLNQKMLYLILMSFIELQVLYMVRNVMGFLLAFRKLMHKVDLVKLDDQDLIILAKQLWQK